MPPTSDHDTLIRIEERVIGLGQRIDDKMDWMDKRSTDRFGSIQAVLDDHSERLINLETKRRKRILGSVGIAGMLASGAELVRLLKGK